MQKSLKDRITKLLSKDVDLYINSIKPRLNAKTSKRKFKNISELIRGLILGQSCFINDISKHTKGYTYRKDKNNNNGKFGININAQINKISNYLLIPLDQLRLKYLSVVRDKYFNLDDGDVNNGSDIDKLSIKERVYNQRIMIHDTTDIQKEYSVKMENLCSCRDGSAKKYKDKKSKTGKGYLIEASIAYHKGRITPLILNLYSYADIKHMGQKEETLGNLRTLRYANISDKFLHVYDRGYDDISFILSQIKEFGTNILVRTSSKRLVVEVDEYNELSKNCKTKKDKKDLFYSMDALIKRMKFCKSNNNKWLKLSYSSIFVADNSRTNGYDNLSNLSLVSARVNTDYNNYNGHEYIVNVLGLDKNNERVIHFLTSYPVYSTEDAEFIFFCYMKRWKVETYFRYLKQVFNLEKIRVLSFKKIRNLCHLLVIASNYLYDKFGDFVDINDKSQTIKLVRLLNKDNANVRRANDDILKEYLFFAYRHYLKECNLTINCDSYSKFIQNIGGYEIYYTNNIINYDSCNYSNVLDTN